jgi:hypothetical protein
LSLVFCCMARLAATWSRTTTMLNKVIIQALLKFKSLTQCFHPDLHWPKILDSDPQWNHKTNASPITVSQDVPMFDWKEKKSIIIFRALMVFSGFLSLL